MENSQQRRMKEKKQKKILKSIERQFSILILTCSILYEKQTAQHSTQKHAKFEFNSMRLRDSDFFFPFFYGLAVFIPHSNCLSNVCVVEAHGFFFFALLLIKQKHCVCHHRIDITGLVL